MELEKVFSKEEVWKAINDLGNDKAPGQMVSILPFFIMVVALSRRKLLVYLHILTRKIFLRKA